jgi:hypothetical protein
VGLRNEVFKNESEKQWWESIPLCHIIANERSMFTLLTSHTLHPTADSSGLRSYCIWCEIKAFCTVPVIERSATGKSSLILLSSVHEIFMAARNAYCGWGLSGNPSISCQSYLFRCNMQSKVPSEHMSCVFQRAYHILQWDMWTQSSHPHLYQHIYRKQ